MDVLSDVLAAVHLTGAIFFDSTFRSQWVAEAPKASTIAHRVMPHTQYVFYFHTLLEGACWAELTDSSMDPIRLQAGDVIAFPMDDPHVLTSTIGLRAEPELAIFVHPIDRQLPYVINQGSGEESCRFVCGYLGCDVQPYNPLIQSLPRIPTLAAQRGRIGSFTLCDTRYPKQPDRMPAARPCWQSWPNCSSSKSFASTLMVFPWSPGAGCLVSGIRRSVTRSA